jgi:hypothetical protein
MHLVGYLYEDYHDARSREHKVIVNSLGGFSKNPETSNFVKICCSMRTDRHVEASSRFAKFCEQA